MGKSKQKHTKLEEQEDGDRSEAVKGAENDEGRLEDGAEAKAPSRKRKRKRKEKKKGDEAEEKVEETYQDNAPVPGSEAFANDRTVYIEGVPFKATEHDVREFFAPAGGTILSCRLPTWHDSGNLRGYGHMEFDSVEACEKAIELDGSYLKDRYIKVERPRVPRILQQAAKDKSEILRPAGCKSVFVKNIPYDTTEEDMREAFKVCGVIDNVRLAVWGHTNQLKGFGYVDFKREDSAEIAVKKTGAVTIKGRPLLVDFETGKAKMSFKGQGEKKAKSK